MDESGQAEGAAPPRVVHTSGEQRPDPTLQARRRNARQLVLQGEAPARLQLGLQPVQVQQPVALEGRPCRRAQNQRLEILALPMAAWRTVWPGTRLAHSHCEETRTQ